MNKKIMSLILTGVLSVGCLVGCGNDNIEEEKKQTYQYENQDENLNEYYNNYENEETALVEEIMVKVCEACFGNTVDWEVTSQDNIICVDFLF